MATIILKQITSFEVDKYETISDDWAIAINEQGKKALCYNFEEFFEIPEDFINMEWSFSESDNEYKDFSDFEIGEKNFLWSWGLNCIKLREIEITLQKGYFSYEEL